MSIRLMRHCGQSDSCFSYHVMMQNLFLILFLFWSGLAAQAQARSVLKPEAGFIGITGKVVDRKTGLALPSRIEVYNEAGELQETYYKYIPGIFTDEDGTFRMTLSPGKYKIKVSHSIDHLSQQHAFEITDTQGVDAIIQLEPWVPLHEKGWINGEAHAHLYTEKKPDNEMLQSIRKITRAQGMDFICAAQGWAGADDDTWKKDYATISDSHFLMYYGAEMPKYRTGHTFWIGLESTKGFFWNTMDTVYENAYYQSLTATHWNFSSVDLPNFTDVELVPRLARAQNAAAIVAHPTRWWIQDRPAPTQPGGKISKYTNNAAANMAFNLLSGNLWDGMVVMGDSKDHYSYQNFWFHILNEGYRMPALSELDGGNTPEHKSPYGLMRTYFHIDTTNENTIQAVVDAVRGGKTFVTSGPIILTNIDNTFSIGNIIPTGNALHTLHLEAYASGDQDDFLSYVIIFRNGKIWKYWDLRREAPRAFKEDVPITEKERAWYVIKAYGKNAWDNPESLDVMTWFDKNTKEEHKEHDVCLTSPYYFLPKGMEKPGPMTSDVSLSMVLSDKTPAQNGTLEIYRLGKKINTIPFANGAAHFTMPVNAIVKIMAEGQPIVRRGLYLDFEPHRKLLENLSNGDWREEPEFRENVIQGYIPWKAFQLDETRKLLRHVAWEVTLLPNERDKQWEKFEQLFSQEK